MPESPDDIRDMAAGVAFLVLKLPDGADRMEKATNLIAEAMNGLRERDAE
jgi:hypothetical protein